MHPPIAIEKIVENAEKHSKNIIITGGEPLTWDMGPLTEMLKQKGMQIHIETSGAYELTGTWDWICLSQNKMKLLTEEIYQVANELKVIFF